MYTRFIGLGRRPFSLEPDPAYLFFSRAHDLAFARLEYGLRHSGFIALTGETGTGKTILLKYLISRAHRTHQTAMVLGAPADSRSVLQAIAGELESANFPALRSDLLEQLHSSFIKLYALGKKTLILIDEAQHLSLDAFEELRMLSNLEADDQSLVQVIFAGQPQLRQTLANSALSQLTRRISVYCHLANLEGDEVSNYIEHRLKVAGYTRTDPLFSNDAIQLIRKVSKGLPRAINTLCESALVYAYAENSPGVGSEIVRRAIDDHPLLFGDTAENVIVKVSSEKSDAELLLSGSRLPLFSTAATVKSGGGLHPVAEAVSGEPREAAEPSGMEAEFPASTEKPTASTSGHPGANDEDERGTEQPGQNQGGATSVFSDSEIRGEDSPLSLTPDVAMMISWLETRIARLEHSQEADEPDGSICADIFREIEALREALADEKKKTREVVCELNLLKLEQHQLQRNCEELKTALAEMQSSLSPVGLIATENAVSIEWNDTGAATDATDRLNGNNQDEAAKHHGSANVYSLEGHALLREGRIREAEDAFMEASKLAPLWPEPYIGLAETYSRAGKLDGIVEELEAEYRQRPASTSLCLQLAILHEFRGSVEGAIQFYSDLAEKTDSPIAYNNLAYIHAENSVDPASLQQAEKLITRALDAQPDNPKFLDTAAWISFKLGDVQSAWERLQYALLGSPEDCIHNLHAAQVLNALGRKTEALAFLDNILQRELDGDLLMEASELKSEWTAAGR